MLTWDQIYSRWTSLGSCETCKLFALSMTLKDPYDDLFHLKTLGTNTCARATGIDDFPQLRPQEYVVSYAKVDMSYLDTFPLRTHFSKDMKHFNWCKVTGESKSCPMSFAS
jgi:hypothetical protein